MKILFNGRIYTNHPEQPIVSALAIEQGRILAIGSDDAILSLAGPHTIRENLEGKTVLPGLTDAHIHLEYYARSLATVDCETLTRAECLKRVAQRARSVTPGQWIRGHGWNQNLWPEGFGSASDLDQVAPNHPVYLTAKSVHAAWANTAALRLAGITEHTPDPQGGKLLRDENGRPTGILLETAMELVERVIPPPSVEELAGDIETAQRLLFSLGLTGVHDYDQARCFSALQVLDARGALKLRVVKGIPLELLSEATRLGLRSGFGSPHLRIGSVKLFADGALGPHTAAMLQPYEDNPGNTGILFLDAEQILEYGQQAVTGGLSLAIHAIGDRANHEVLEAYRQLRAYEKRNGLAPLRHRIEHVQCLHPDDLGKLAELDIIASVQPIHATSDMLIADRYWGTRSQGAYAYRTLLERGTRLAFGSDSPVESPNPWWGIHAAVTRQRQDGTPSPEGWYPAQRLSFTEALAGYTTGPAFAAGWENALGRLAPGFLADLILLDASPLDIPPQELFTVQPAATMIDGEWVWQRE